MAIDRSLVWRLMPVAIVTGVIVVGLALLVPAVQMAREAARRAQSKNNLRQIGLSLINYHYSYHDTLPPGGIFDETGKEFFGWQASILPYLDAGTLYNEIDFNRPWDDPRNRPHFRRHRYAVYVNPSIDVLSENDGIHDCHYAANKHLLFPNSSMSLTDITDGTEQTILAGGIFADFLPYPKPGNWRDPAAGIHRGQQSFGHPHSDGAHFLMADSRVHWLSKEIDPSLLRALGTPAGNDKFPDGVIPPAPTQD